MTAHIKLTNSHILADLTSYLQHLDSPQRAELTTLVPDNVSMCQDFPTVTNTFIQEVCRETNATPIRQHAYRLNPAVLKTEIDYILEHSNSQWVSPVILIQKGENSFRGGADLRRVNQLIKADAYPLPRLDDCIDHVGHTQYITKLD